LIGLVFAVLFSLGIYHFFNYKDAYSMNQTGIEGTVRKLEGGWWGIQSEGLVDRRILVKNLPDQFKKNGILVDCNVVVIDTISTPEWNVITEVNSCASIY